MNEILFKIFYSHKLNINKKVQSRILKHSDTYNLNQVNVKLKVAKQFTKVIMERLNVQDKMNTNNSFINYLAELL